MIAKFGRAVYTRLLSFGIGINLGTVIGYAIDTNDKQQAMEMWAFGSTFIVMAGIWYLCTRKHWDAKGALL